MILKAVRALTNQEAIIQLKKDIEDLKNQAVDHESLVSFPELEMEMLTQYLKKNPQAMNEEFKPLTKGMSSLEKIKALMRMKQG